MRVAVFVLALLGLVGLSSAQIAFTNLAPQTAMWSARDQAAIEYISKPAGTSQTFTDYNGARVTLSNYFLLYGGTSDQGAQNDVWVSSNGQRWAFVAGVSDGTEHPSYPTTFDPWFESFACQDNNFKQYRAGGRRDGVVYNSVWVSVDGYNWQPRTDAAQWSPRYFASMVSDTKNNIYLAGGIIDDAGIGENAPRRSSGEVWMSTWSSGGQRWTKVNRFDDEDNTGVNDGPTRRAVAILLSTAQDQLIWLTGVNTGYGPIANDPYESYLQDAWASSNGGKTWGLVNYNTSYGRRDDANAEITSGGLIVLAGGYGGSQTQERHNDVWLSANGGYTWGLCQKDSAWDDRRYQMTLLDGNGYLWVMGGQNSDGQRLDDVWRSRESFNDASLVIARCHTSVPSCGTGLRCNPGAGTLVAADGSGAYCDSCPYTFSGAAAQVTTLTAFLVVFVILTVLALLALGYTFYKLRSAGTPSPIPLPASAQRWWNKTAAGGAIGSTDTSSTTNGDGLYQPLRIRDQV